MNLPSLCAARAVRAVALAGAALMLAAGLAPAGAGSGAKVPRFVSLKSGTVNLRKGPGRQYPILWVFKRKSMPLEILREHDTWRQVRDWQGVTGWVHQGTLSGRRMVLVTGRTHTLRSAPAPGARAVARAEPGVIGRLLECAAGWCRVNIGGYRGWLRRRALWGVYANERIE